MSTKDRQDTKIGVLYVLIATYFISLHPWSGFLGGFVFLLTGWAIPSVLNLYASYLITLYIAHEMRYIFKILVFVLTSFVLGVNVKIIYLFSLRNINATVEIIKPLRVHPSACVYQKMPAGLNLKPSPFDSVSVSGDEGCMCMYFVPPKSLLFESTIITLNRLVKKNQIEMRSYCKLEYADYSIYYSTRLEGNELLLQTSIKDKEGGYVIINSLYPKSLIFVDEFVAIPRADILKGSYYWKYTTAGLINDNFWQWFLAAMTTSQDPLTALYKVKGAFLES